MTKQTIQVKRDSNLDMLYFALEIMRGQGIFLKDKRLNALFTKMYNYVGDMLSDGIDGEIVDIYTVYEVVPNKSVTPSFSADTVSNTSTL